MIHRSERARPRLELWLLPLAFVVHDSETWLTLPGWLAEHGTILDNMVDRHLGPNASILLTSATQLTISLAMLALLGVLAAVTACATLFVESRAIMLLYLLMLGAFFVHGFAHVGQSILFRSYTPGLVTAVLVVILASAWLYRRLRRSEVAADSTLVVTAILGSALIAPGILLALLFGRQVAG